jgi:outer membrane protein assembly factor BamB
MRSWLPLAVLVVLAACDDGGSDSISIPPAPPWGNFRHDILNSGATGLIDSNTGCVSNPIDLDGTTLSTPTIDLNGNILIGTRMGLMAFDPNCFVQNAPCSPSPTPSMRCPIWTLSECILPCEPPGCTEPMTVPVDAISTSPTVTAGGTIIFATTPVDGRPGRVFAVQEQGSGPPTCTWVYPLPEDDPNASRSSAVAQINAIDLTLASAFIGGDGGVVRALNADGTVRWEFQTRSTAHITSTPALDGSNNLYVTAADGSVTAIDLTGREEWRVVIGNSPGAPFDAACCHDPTAAGCNDPAATARCFQPSAAIGESVYALGSGGSLFAISSNGINRWQFRPARPVTASPAFGQLVFNVGAINEIDTVVYAVDPEGTAYAVRDATGTALQLQRCSDNVDEDCRIDSCAPPQTCNSSDVCGTATSGPSCTPDSCLPTGMCLLRGRCRDTPATACFLNTCLLEDGECNPTTALCSISGRPCLIETCPPGGGTCNSETNTCTGSGTPCLTRQCGPGEDLCVRVRDFAVGGVAKTVTTSPVLTSDPFVIIGTADGQVCARWLDGSIPGSDRTPAPDSNWIDGSGCVDLDADAADPTLSSPIIGPTGAIYVTTRAGLYEIQ